MTASVFNWIWDEKHGWYILQKKILSINKNVNAVKGLPHNIHMPTHAHTYIKKKTKGNKNTNTENSGNLHGKIKIKQQDYLLTGSPISIWIYLKFSHSKIQLFSTLWRTFCTWWSNIFQREISISKLYISSAILSRGGIWAFFTDTTLFFLSQVLPFLAINQWILHVCYTFL